MKKNKTIIKAKKTQEGLVYLNLGCGYNFFTEWNNVDLLKNENIIQHNIKEELPFYDETFDAVYSSHALEHLTPQDGKKMIKEVFRILKKGGIFRIVVPDLEEICREYLKIIEECDKNLSKENIQKYNWITLELIDQMVREKSGGLMLEHLLSNNYNKEYITHRTGNQFAKYLSSGEKTEITNKKTYLKKLLNTIKNKIFTKEKLLDKSGQKHKWMYDRISLKILLEEINFNTFEIKTYLDSKIKFWDKYNLDKEKESTLPKKPNSLYIEVTKN